MKHGEENHHAAKCISAKTINGSKEGHPERRSVRRFDRTRGHSAADRTPRARSAGRSTAPADVFAGAARRMSARMEVGSYCRYSVARRQLCNHFADR